MALTTTYELNSGQIRVMELIRRDRDVDGWALVSWQLLPHLQRDMPEALVMINPTDHGGIAMLTEEGERVLDEHLAKRS